MLGPKGPFCQSCGMPLSKDEGHGGTNADGTKSTDFCSKCYKDGKFTEPAITLEEMQQKVEGKMRDMHFPRFMARWFTKDMAELKRWKKQ